MYKITNDLISEVAFEKAIKVVKESDLNARKTPCILVSGDMEDVARCVWFHAEEFVLYRLNALHNKILNIN